MYRWALLEMDGDTAITAVQLRAEDAQCRWLRGARLTRQLVMSRFDCVDDTRTILNVGVTRPLLPYYICNFAKRIHPNKSTCGGKAGF